MKRRWHGLERAAPGHRFQNRYENAHRKGREVPVWHRVVRFGAALVLAGLGVIFAFIPGPAFVFFGLAGALLATESRRTAKLLDWTEVKLRELGRGAKKRWKALPLFGKIAVAATAALIAGAFLAAMIWFYFFR